jgi:peptide-methionine (S)-S-oxide reductase
MNEIKAEETYDKPIVTQLEPLKVFYNAEDYHKDYFKRHPDRAYCSLVIALKIAKFQKLYLSKLKLQKP